MAGRDYKLNKSEFTRMRRQQQMYQQFLPILKLKKEQLQMEHLRLKREVERDRGLFEQARKAVNHIVPLLAERLPLDFTAMSRAKDIVIREKIIAGVHVPVLEEVVFPEIDAPKFGMPPWVSRSLPRLRALVEARIRVSIREEQYKRVGYELRKATQKVNLFEKVMIPEIREAIRRIRIALGDQEVAAVCRGKIAKSKKLQSAAGGSP